MLGDVVVRALAHGAHHRCVVGQDAVHNDRHVRRRGNELGQGGEALLVPAQVNVEQDELGLVRFEVAQGQRGVGAEGDGEPVRAQLQPQGAGKQRVIFDDEQPMGDR